MMAIPEPQLDGLAWLRARVNSLTTHVDTMTPSEWAERNRYLPPSNTSLPGRYRFDVSPYLREIVDCLDVDSPIREVAVMKGAQVCATVGLLENCIGYAMAHVKNAPCMIVTADAELAALRIETNIIPMIQESGLADLIMSSDTLSKRKTGKTSKKLEWHGGGFLLPFGAVNANKMRSMSAQFLLRDEVDGWLQTVGKDGDPMQLTLARTNGYEATRKVLDLSTPTLKGLSKIAKRYELGDKRQYFVCCLRCNHAQTLRWSRTGPGGEVSAIVYELDSHGKLIPESVAYLCEKCQHPHRNHDKIRLLSPSNGAEWRPTAVPSSPFFRSYHIPALLSPVGMQTWESCVRMWLDAWDVEHNRVKDIGQLQVFYNNVLGEPFEMMGQKLRFEHVSSHRRMRVYSSGEVPNRFAAEFAGGPVLVVVCTVDVHGDNLAVAVWGWCRDLRVFLISYQRFDNGNTEDVGDPATWGRLSELIESDGFVADDGKRYRIEATLIDTGYRTEVVHDFCAQYASGVFPIKGLPLVKRSPKIAFFTQVESNVGAISYGIYADLYKDRWGTALRRSWDGQSLQPATFFNAPQDIDDKQLGELTAESKRAIIDTTTKEIVGYEWHRPSSHTRNELWDLLVYANAAIDIIAHHVCITQGEREEVSWHEFWTALESGMFFTSG